jgi:hypothetical protein
MPGGEVWAATRGASVPELSRQITTIATRAMNAIMPIARLIIPIPYSAQIKGLHLS